MKKAEKRSVQIGVRINRTMKQQLVQIADAEERTLTSLVYKIVKEYLARLDHDHAQGR